ncbi:hemoglobin subunit alpha-like [Lepisosteus oculatus]|uniref:Hemoglobin subunit alpha 2 n=1 Tax=Lepisosteus oculatus TaxID=7918 RepID=W5MLZ3_LEPOC|nr:PREDICTED: hemoglobin subunit alpha-like [Lepisosteus oculatus]
MTTASEKALVSSIWKKAADFTEEWGEDALLRLLTVFPQTKTYFTNVDITPGSAKLRAHGGKVMTALAQAAADIDNISSVLSSLSDLHAYILRVDPVNFKLLAHCILVVLANRLPAEFTPEAHVACDKFLVRVAEVLSQKYR